MVTVNIPRPKAHRSGPSGPRQTDNSDATGHIVATRLTPRALPGRYLLAAPTALLLIWVVASAAGWTNERLLPAPWTIVRTGWELATSGDLFTHLEASAFRAYSGLAIGVVLGIVLALASGLSRLGEATFDSLIQIFRAVPTLALLPLAIIWLGIGETMKISLITLSVAVPVYINTHAAIVGIDRGYVELAQSLRLTRSQFIRRVVIPGALPGFFTGLRMAVTLCWASLVVLEQINATSGIGFFMTRARSFGQTDIIFVGIIIYAVLGLASDLIVRAVQNRTLSYRKGLQSA